MYKFIAYKNMKLKHSDTYTRIHHIHYNCHKSGCIACGIKDDTTLWTSFVTMAMVPNDQ